jgi:signal peptidase I
MLGRNKEQAASNKGGVGPCCLLPVASCRLLRLPFVYPLVAFLRARRVVINGWSMYPTLAPGERVLFDTLAYRLERPQRGDVVLARHPTRSPLKLVKRVAAVPGDRATVEGDDWHVEEAPDPDVSRSEESGGVLRQVWILGEDDYFLVGDAPDLSTDARHFGPTSGRDILGRAWLVYWPARRMRVIS